MVYLKMYNNILKIGILNVAIETFSSDFAWMSREILILSKSYLLKICFLKIHLTIIQIFNSF